MQEEQEQEEKKNEDPKKVYFQKMAAEFASGFFFGIKVGGFDENDLYDCLQNETEAYDTFTVADNMMKQGMKGANIDGDLVVGSLQFMSYFSYEMATEQNENKSSCPILH